MLSYRMIAVFLLFVFAFQANGLSPSEHNTGSGGFDARPDLEWAQHSLGDLTSGILNNGVWGDAEGSFESMAWPSGSGNSYLWMGSLWTCAYGQITSSFPDSAAKWASVADYGDWEFTPSDGYPMTYQSPGTVATEESWYSTDDWYEGSSYQEDPYGLMVFVKNSSWDIDGYNDFIASEMVFTHHSEYGNPGVPLNGFVPAMRGDCDVAISDPTSCAIDDLVYYDGHAIWASGSHTFDYQFADGTMASTQDQYTWQQNPESPLDPSDPDNVFYYYNYSGADGIPDNDVDQNGVSDHFTILGKVVGSDTLHVTDPATGIELFSAGMPYFHYTQVVGDTTYLVVPRNLSYMWDSDYPGSTEDDSGEQDLAVTCTGFIGWRLIDFYVLKADQTVERPADVWGYPIPLCHTWWNWEGDPGTDPERYDVAWGIHPIAQDPLSGPAYLSDWAGNPDTPEAFAPANPGPYPIVQDCPINMGEPVFDYRFFLSAGIADLADGDELHVIGGWVIGNGLDGLRMNADLMLDAYYRGGTWGQGLGIEEGQSVLSSSLQLHPNPVRGGLLSASFILGEPAFASMCVYDLSGRVVMETGPSAMSSGVNSFSIDGSALGNGVYFAIVRADDTLIRGRFVVTR